MSEQPDRHDDEVERVADEATDDTKAPRGADAPAETPEPEAAGPAGVESEPEETSAVEAISPEPPEQPKESPPQPAPAASPSRLHDWLELARIPNVFTAVADPLAGALIVGAALSDVHRVLAVMIASALLYTGGIILNDWRDYSIDRIERPARPLPSGRIPRWAALLVALVLLAAGAGVTVLLGPPTVFVGGLLLLAILLYDLFLKEVPIAPGGMGLCRALNLLLGMSLVAVGPEGPALRIYLLIAMTVYVTGVTAFARREASPGNTVYLIVSAAVTCVAVLVLAGVGLFFADRAGEPLGLVWIALLLAALGFRMTQAIVIPEPSRIQAAVTVAILGIILFDAAAVAYTQGLPASFMVVILLVPALWLGRRLYST